MLNLPVAFFRGTFDIFVKLDGVERSMGSYDNRGSFGELALMYNTGRAATIVATSAGALWCLVSPCSFPHMVKNRHLTPITSTGCCFFKNDAGNRMRE